MKAVGCNDQVGTVLRSILQDDRSIGENFNHFRREMEPDRMSWLGFAHCKAQQFVVKVHPVDGPNSRAESLFGRVKIDACDLLLGIAARNCPSVHFDGPSLREREAESRQDTGAVGRDNQGRKCVECLHTSTSWPA